MKQTITLIAFLCFALLNFLHAQNVTFFLSDEEISCDLDEIVTVEFSVENWNDVAGAQGTIVFDPDELQVDEVRGFFPSGLFVPNINNTLGFITFSWFVPVGGNLPNGTVVMEIDFELQNGGVIAIHPVEFSNSPTPLEVTITPPGGSPSITPVDTEDGSITVIDDVEPTISCPADVNVVVDFGETGSVVNNIAPDADDNCDVESVVYDISGATSASGDDDASGTFFELGESTVEYTATDFGSNSAACSFTVTISEAAPPVPGEVTLNVVSSEASCNDEGSVSVSVEGMEDVETLHFSISFDASALTYASAVNLIGGSLVVDDSDAGSGLLGFSFENTDGYNEDDGTSILTINFSTDSDLGVFDIEFGDSPTPIGGTDIDDEDLTVLTNNGDFTIFDNEDPFIECPDNVVVDAESGETTAVVDDIEPADFGDNCGIDGVAYSLSGATSGSGDDDASGTEFNAGVTTVTYTATDLAGNESECSFTVTVNVEIPVSDTITLVITTGVADCGNEVSLDVQVFNFNDVRGVQFSINWDADNFSFVSGTPDFPGGSPLINSGDDFLSFSGFAGSDVSLPNGHSILSFTLEAFGPEGIADVVFSNSPLAVEITNLDGPLPHATLNGSVEISDTEDPVISCPANVVEEAPFGSSGVAVTGIAPTSASDDCGVGSIVYSLSGATSGSGDDDASGEFFNVGVTTVTYTVTDVNDNSAECSFEVTVEEAVAGDDIIIYVQDYVVDCNLDQVVVSVRLANFEDVLGIQYSVNWDENALEYVSSEVTIPNGTSDINDDFVDDGQLATSWASNAAPALNNGDAILEITFNVLSANGVSSAIEITDIPVDIEFSNLSGQLPYEVINGSFLYQDDEAPTAECPADVVAFVENLGDPSVEVNNIEVNADDNCEVESVTFDVSGATSTSGDDDASGTEFNLGVSTVTYTVSDNAGNTAECSFSVDVKPLLSELVTLYVSDADPSCGDIFTIDITADDFIGIGGVQFTVAWDENVIEFIDFETFFPNGQSEANDSLVVDGLLLFSWAGTEDVVFDDGTVIITLTFQAIGELGESTPVEIIDTPLDIEFSSLEFLVNDIPYEVFPGEVNIIDIVDPIALCQDITVELDANGEASIEAADVDGGSSDNCGVISLAIDVNSFDCDDVGQNTVVLTVTDPSGNSASCEAIVSVEDNISPTALCQDAIVELDENGEGSISVDDIDNGSFDNCDIASLVLSATDFDCDDVGDNPVTLTVTDVNGNVSSCVANVDVQDNIAPTALCQDALVELDENGEGSIGADDIDNGSFDNCDIESLELSVTDFDCDDIGSNSVVLTVTDVNGNVSSCEANVEVEDNLAPILVCVDSTEIFLDENGEAALDLDDVVISVSDNCEVEQLFANVDQYDCSLVGSHDLFITAIDPSGNETTCDFHLQVIDNIPPVLVCVDSLTIALDATGFASLDLDDVVIEVSDACGIAELFANVDEYDCDLVGEHDLFVTAIDSNGNESTCDFHLTVVDNIAPELSCVDSLEISLDSTGFAALDINDVVVSVSDACGIAELFANVEEYDCDLVGEHDLFVTAIDSNGNESTCDFHLTVVDDIAPVLVCVGEIDIFLSEDGAASVDPLDLVESVSDNCEVDAVNAEPITFSCDDVGIIMISVEASDVNGNVSSCQVTANVQDTIPPTLICNDITVELDANGQVIVTADDVDGGSFDNCGIASVDPEFVILTCDDIGENAYVGVVTDVNGNSASCEVTVTVEDNLPPVAQCVAGFEVELLPPDFTFVLEPSDIDDGSFDNCGDVTLSIEPTELGIGDVGSVDVVLTVTDGSGNTSTCVTTLTVIDLPPCEITCPDDVVVSNDPGQCGAFIDLPEAFLTGFCTAPNIVFFEGFDGCAQPAGWTNTSTSASINTNAVACFAPFGVGNMFSYQCVNGVPFGGVAVPPTFATCQATIDTDRAGAGAIYRGKHCQQSPTIDLSAGGAQMTFDFQNRPLGAGGIFTAEAWDGNSWNVLFQTNALASNSGETVSLAAYSNSDFQVRFCYDDNGVWAWGSAVDNIEILALGGGSDPAIVNDFNDGGANAAGFYPVGTTVVTFGIPNTGIECSTTITVEDNEPPVFTNCQDYEFTLAAGECGIIFNFELEATDNCPVSAESVAGPYCDPCNDATGGSALACAPFAQNAIIQFIDLPSAGIMDYFCFNQETFGNAEPATIHFYEAQAPGVVPYIGGGFTPFYSIDYQTNAADDGTCVCVDFPDPVDVPAGGIWVEVWTPGLTLNSRVVQTPPSCDGNTGTGMNTFIQAPACGFVSPVPFSDIGFFLDAGFAIGFSAGDLVGSPDPNAPAGVNEFESGDFLPIGVHCFQYVVEDAAGNEAVCEFCVTVNEFPNPTSVLACNDFINFSLDQNCEGLINADMILEGGPYRCYDEYEIILETSGGMSVPNPITGDFIGETLMVTIVDPVTGNSCWGNIFVEDKIKPTIECRDLTIVCGDIIPDVPAPGIEGPQSIIEEGLNDQIGIPNFPAFIDYPFDFGYLPADATVENVGVRLKLSHTWAADLNISVTGPDGTSATVFNVTGGTGCLFTPVTIDVTFDDNGAAVPSCSGLNLDGDLVQPLTGAAVPTQNLGNFVGTFASGEWIVRIEDNVFFDDALVEIVGLILDVDAEQIDPADNCGDVFVDFTESIADFGCDAEFGQVITRTWTATDQSGNQSSCDQTINVLRVTIDELVAPPNFDGISNPPLSCGGNWDINGNGYPDPEETSGFTNNCDNIAFTYEDLLFDVCGTGFKILRKWIIYDWCTDEIGYFNQLIKVEDDVAPVFDPACENPVTVSTDVNQCERLMWFVPIPEFLEDACVDEVSYTVTSSVGNVTQNNQGAWIVQNLPVGEHTVTYVASDGCDNVSTCSFTLNVVDNVAPVALCDIDTRVSLGSDGNALVHWTAFDDGSYDNCGIAEIGLQRDISNPGGRAGCGNSPGANVWVPQLNFCCDDLVRSPILVNVRVVDISGNTNVCQVEVDVTDKLAPVVACPDPIEVDLNCLYDFGSVAWGEAIGNDNAANVSGDALQNIELFGEHFGRIVRTQNPFNETPRNFEINPTGNPNSSTRIQISDGTAVDNCPTSGEGLRVFETYRITVDPHCGNVGTSVSQLNPFKGNLAIERNFYVVDGQGNGNAAPNAGFGNPNTATCTQRIYVTNNNPFQGLTRMQWENNALGQANIIRTINECGGDDPDLNEIGEIDKARILNYINNRPDAACANLLVGYTDMEFSIVNDACFKVLRQWKVIDWCQHDPNSGAGEWTFIQQIKVMDTAGPECDGCGERDFAITEGDGCEGFVDFEVEFMDGCTPDEQLEIRFQVDAFNTGSFDIDQTFIGAANAVNANRVLPFGDHRVRWTVSDMCGNVSVFEYEFSVVDGKEPTPVCIHGLVTVIMPAADPPCIELSADAYDAGSFDNCTESGDLIFSFSADITETTKVFCCDDLGTNIVEIWVTDEAGNQDYCETYILIQDPNEVCADQSIAGLLETEENESIGNADVNLTRDGGLFRTESTIDDGLFSFNALPLSSDYTVTPEKDINPLNGVTTYDIALIQRHILGIEYLDSPYKLIAADVRADGVINVLDVADLRALILGKRDGFVNNTSWKFVSSDQIFPAGMVQPPHPSEIETLRNYDDFMASVRDANFIGVKIGDVNNTNQPNSLVGAESRSFGNEVNMLIDRVDFNAGDLVEVAFRASDFNEILGYQFTLNFDNSMIEFNGFEAGLLEGISENNFGFHMLDNGMITTSWNTSKHVSLSADEVLFTLEFIARQSGSTSNLFSVTSAVTASEAYRAGEGIIDVNLLVVDERGAFDSDVFALYQNTPNPFNQHTTIGFVVPESVSGTLTIYDVTGKVVKVIEDDFTRGYNQVTLTRGDLPANGVYYYQLEAGNHNATKKMMLIE